MGRWINTLVRAGEDEGRLVAGVCAGLARAVALDVTLVRLAFLVLALAQGLGLALYLVGWLLMPSPRAREERGFSGVIWFNMRGIRGELWRLGQRLADAWQRQERDPWPLPVSRRWLAIGLVCGGAAVLLYSLGVFAWLGPLRALGLAAMALGGAVLLSLAPRR